MKVAVIQEPGKLVVRDLPAGGDRTLVKPLAQSTPAESRAMKKTNPLFAPTTGGSPGFGSGGSPGFGSGGSPGFGSGGSPCRRIPPLPTLCAAIVLVLALPLAARDVAPQAQVAATVNAERARAAVDGKVPPAGSRDDAGQTWVVSKADLPASLVFTWEAPQAIHSLAYYARTTWGMFHFEDYEIRLDDATEPVVKGAFRPGHGPQVVELPEGARADKLTLTFLSGQGNQPGASEVQIFSATPAPDDLLCHFTDFSLDYRYAYYPSHNLVRIHLPDPPADATDWHLALRPEAGGAVLAERSGKLPTAPGGEPMPVPDLPEGDYSLTLTLAGGAEPVVEERHIRRDRPEWEGNRLGLEDIVIPPFEPLAVDDGEPVVHSVLRSHAHGEAGLWRQVVSQDRELLAAPVRLELTRGDTVYTASGGPPRMVETTPTRVRGEADWTAGPLSGTTRFVYDVDGLKTITLELAPTDEPIDRLQFVIPLQTAETWLMHPVTTGLRQHFAGRIPAGEGRVWDSSGVPNRLNGIFVPYIYLGGTERGVCFAADNDRDWITDKDIPMMVIDREGDSVVLRLNLIARPARLERPRTLTFSLQATPAKPMPEEPYNWRRWWATRTERDIEDVQINFWGGNMYWGGRHFATSVYPAFEDYGFWEHLAWSRRTGQRDPEFEQQWLARFENLPAKDYNSLKAHYNAGLTWAAGIRPITSETTKFNYVIPYTNPRGAHIETREFLTTYIDEWLQGDIVDPRWNNYSTFQRPRRVHPTFVGAASWYQVEPVSSRIDMLLFYHKKMLETFADGIYWDNFFLQPNYAPAEAGGPGYVDDDGRPRAGVNLMGFRELVKRTATLMHVMGKRPLTYIHMTNVNIVPMLSFGTLNLDWEWRDQGRFASMDLQDRMNLDLVLAHNLGLQTGNLSVGITGNILKGGAGIPREWLHRTGMAVCFPHEIRMHQGTSEVSFVQTQMARFGYGLPECRVFRYWEDGFPLETEGAEMRALALAHDGRALIALGNFGPADAVGAAKPADQEDGPTLEEYDAAQRGETQAKVAGTDPADRQTKQAVYTVRLELDLASLGVAESAQAWDVELKAGREKAENPAAIKPPARPDITPNLLQDDVDGLGIELEEKNPAVLKRLAPGVFELTIGHHDFALILVE